MIVEKTFEKGALSCARWAREDQGTGPIRARHGRRWDRLSLMDSFREIKRTGPNPSLYYIIRFADLGFAVQLISAGLSPSHPITALSAPNALALSSHLPPLFSSRSSFLSLTLPCIFLVAQSICSPFNSPSWAPFAVVLRFALSFLLYYLLIFPSKVIDFDADVNLFHFMLLRCVGKGAFGKVPFAEGYPYLLNN